MIISQTPLRISFAGGGTDLPAYYEHREGYVVSAAIDKFVFVVVNPRCDEKIYVNYTRKEIVDHVDEIRHELVREAMRVTGVAAGVEITMLSDVPAEGAGLGSSSSFTVGLLNALHMYQGEQVSPAQLAEEACDIEISRCGKPIGKQDQYIAAFGGLTAFRFARRGHVRVERIALCAAKLRRFAGCLFLFYSGLTRSAAHILSEQNSRTGENLHLLDGIKALALDVRSSLTDGDFDRIGKILEENWQLKRQLAAPITNATIEEMRARAMQAGASGAKVCGAGGGGFLLVYCPLFAHDQLLDAMAAYREMPFTFEADGSKIILNYKRSSWK